MQANSHWSDEFTRAILATAGNDPAAPAWTRGQSDVADLESCLVERSRHDTDLQRSLMEAWRNQNSELIAASQIASIDGPACQCEALVRQFGAENVLLELITDDHEDGWELAHWMVANVSDNPVANTLGALLQRWSTNEIVQSAPQKEAAIRLVVLGGKVRDESRMKQRFFNQSAFDVRWRPYEKSQKNPEDSELDATVANADAIVVVTGMISHSIMRRVKRFAHSYAIPYITVPKATIRHFRDALSQAFPDSLNAFG